MTGPLSRRSILQENQIIIMVMGKNTDEAEKQRERKHLQHRAFFRPRSVHAIAGTESQ